MSDTSRLLAKHLPRMIEVGDRIATALENISGQADRDLDLQHNRLTISQMAKDLLKANEDFKSNPDYINSEYNIGRIESFCATAALLGTTPESSIGMDEQIKTMMVIFDEYRLEGDLIFASIVTEHYCGPEGQK